jgi:hypothetical protein
MPPSNEVSVIAFYGIQNTSEVAVLFLESTTEWLHSLGLQPDKIGIHVTGRTGSLRPYSRFRKHADRVDYSTVRGIELYATMPSAKVWWLHSYASAQYEGDKGGTYAFVESRSSILSLDTLADSVVVRRLIDCLRPSYGVGFTRLAQYGPGPFVFGVTCGPPGTGLSGEEYEEGVRVCRWGDTGMAQQVYARGIMRDVFPYNYLNDSHLSNRICGYSFADWVSQDTDRGSLCYLKPDLFLWRVLDHNIQKVRFVLRDAGILFGWKADT